MTITQKNWGTARNGQSVSKYILENENGMRVTLSDFGALILAIELPVAGGLRDVVLGFDRLECYYDNDPGFGAYVGRNANRIGGAAVTLEGVRYQLEVNDNRNNLHSGRSRSYYETYDAQVGQDFVTFTRVSPHLEQGFPGNLEQSVTYRLTQDNELVLSYRMVSDRTTVINPTNHCYFNLAGQDSGDILDHTMTLWAPAFTPTDEELIPTGEVRDVSGTPFDFSTPERVGLRIDDAYAPLKIAGGYDHNYCLENGGRYEKAALLESPDGKVTMTVSTDLCGLQVYAGNFLKGEIGKGGAVYPRRGGICFETQFYPNACNIPTFQSSIFAPGQVYESRTGYRFTFEK